MTSLAELEDSARTLSQRGDIQAATRVCQDILAIDQNHIPSLRFLADLAINASDFRAATGYLTTLLKNAPDNLQVLTQLGQALYQQGKLEEAVAVYTDYWRISPGSGMIYLTLGCLHIECGNLDKAVQIFSLGEAADPKLLSLWRDPEANPGVARMSKIGWDALCRLHTDMHLEAVDAQGDPEPLTRVRGALWPLADAREIDYQHPRQRPQIFSIRHDRSPTFFDTSEFEWRESLEQKYHDIRDEILAGLDIVNDGRPYLTDRHRLEGGQWEPLVNRMSWASVHLYQGGVANEQVIPKFPETLKALARLPLATTNGTPSEVFISVLAPHTKIPAHFGVSSAILTAHLPIEIPAGCGLKVHEDIQTPEAGTLMVFDDTWEHSAWNNSDRPRVVLIFELWHPDLSEQEQEAISRSFEAREQWLKRRKVD